MITRLLFQLYKQTGLLLPFSRYVRLIKVGPPIAGAAAALMVALLLPLPPELRFIGGVAVGAATGLTSLALLVMYPVMLVSRRRTHFESSFIYTLGFMIPLIAARLPLDRVVRVVAETEPDREIAREFRLIVRDIVALGMDPLEALRASGERTPSQSYREVVEVMSEAGRLTERLEEFLLARHEWMLRVKTIRLAAMIRSMALLFETYSVIAILLPVLVAVMAVALSPLGGIAIGSLTLGPVEVLAFTAFVYAPLVGVLFYVLFSLSSGLET